jgi:hypothetical protein
MTGHLDRSRIDVAGEDLAPQQFRGGDRENSATGSDIERLAIPPAPRQALEGHQASARRWVLTGPECCRGVDRDTYGAGRRAAVIMRSIDKKPADSERREGELVFRQPVASRQLLLADLDNRTSRGSGGERQLRFELRPQGPRRLRIRLDPPLLRRGLKRRHSVGDAVEQREHRARCICAPNPREDAPDDIRGRHPGAAVRADPGTTGAGQSLTLITRARRRRPSPSCHRRRRNGSPACCLRPRSPCRSRIFGETPARRRQSRRQCVPPRLPAEPGRR